MSSPGRPLPPRAAASTSHALDTRSACVVASVLLLVTGILLFARLGHYALWDDEAGTALTARSLLRNGDFSARVDDHNIFAYREGFGLQDLKLTYVLPVPILLTAGSFALSDDSSTLAARLPFALLGLATLALFLWWLLRARLSRPLFFLCAFGLALNISFILYFRQSRYYGLGMFLSLAVVHLYLQPSRTPRSLALLGVLSALLFGSNYLNYLALYACLALDYFVWQRRISPLAFAEWCIVLLPQLMLCGLIAWHWNPLLWNPLGLTGGNEHGNSLRQLGILFFWQWRDLNRCEFLCGSFMICAAIVAAVWRDRWLLRGLAAFVLYVACITVLSPQPVALTSGADVRYLSPLIPLAVFLGARAVVFLTQPWPWLAMLLGTLGVGSNFLHGGPLLPEGSHLRVIEFFGELRAPPTDPYRATAQWIDANVRPLESVWVLPEYMAYPLMFHSPHALYAWQLASPAQPQFKDLPRIHFKGKEPPDYVIAFGPVVQQLAGVFSDWQKLGVQMERAAALPHYWRDVHWPEVAWRSFTTVEKFDPSSEAIYIFRRVSPSRADEVR